MMWWKIMHTISPLSWKWSCVYRFLAPCPTMYINIASHCFIASFEMGWLLRAEGLLASSSNVSGFRHSICWISLFFFFLVFLFFLSLCATHLSVTCQKSWSIAGALQVEGLLFSSFHILHSLLQVCSFLVFSLFILILILFSCYCFLSQSLSCSNVNPSTLHTHCSSAPHQYCAAPSTIYAQLEIGVFSATKGTIISRCFDVVVVIKIKIKMIVICIARWSCCSRTLD